MQNYRFTKAATDTTAATTTGTLATVTGARKAGHHWSHCELRNQNGARETPLRENEDRRQRDTTAKPPRVASAATKPEPAEHREPPRLRTGTSREPDLPRASGDHHDSRRCRNLTCDSRATAPSTPLQEPHRRLHHDCAAAETSPSTAPRLQKWVENMISKNY